MFEDCLSIVVGHSQLIHVCHTLLVQSSLYYLIVAATVQRTFGETVSKLLPCIIVFRYTTVTRVSSVAAS